MSMVVRNNLSAINTLNTLNKNHSALAKSLQTVSSGMRINGAKDDASGYAISERMRVQIRSLNQDNRNTQNGHSLMKVAEGAVQSTVDILKALKEKVINAANDTNTDADRMMIQKELDQSIDQINDNANITYNGKYLIDGSKNSKGEANYTTLTNYSLHESTNGADSLTLLRDRNGDNLGIQTSDTLTVSYVQNGKTHSGSYTVGTTSLQNILKFAETLDAGSTFASQNHAGVGAALGITNMDALIQKGRDAAQYATDTSTVAGTAEQWSDDYDTAIDTIEGDYSTLYNTGINPPSTGSFAIAVFRDVVDAVRDWDRTAVSSNGYRDPSNLSSNSTVTTVLGYSSKKDGMSDEEWVWAQNFQNAYTAYKKAYTDLNSFLSSHDLSHAPTATKPATLTDLSDPVYVTTGTYADYAISARNIATTADNYNSSFNSPAIISSDNIGLSHSGEMVKTANNEKALTITAFSSGVAGQISGFTVSITDSEGNIKKSVNAALDAWEESIRAENASKDNAIVLHTGTRANQAIKVGLSDMRAEALGLKGSDGSTLNVSNQKNANAAINVLDNAIQKALDQQTTIGAIESRLEYTSTNLTTAAENVTASESTIRDADMAQAMTQYTKHNILTQASQAMLAQANQNNNQVLSLLR